MKPKQAIRWALLLAAIFVFIIWLQSWVDSPQDSTINLPETQEIELIPPPLSSNLDYYYQAIESGGVTRDGIPAIDTPDFVPIQDADIFMQADDWVMITRTPMGLFIVPQEVLVWHEIINMDWNETESFTFSYCPLTATAIGFHGEGLDFGTSGKLLNSNLVMYDRATNQYWPQMLGRSVTGAPPGLELTHHPIHWSTWRNVKALELDGKVLTTNTGYLREYGGDPYGSHELNSSYYFNDTVLFPLMAETDTWFPKKTVTGLRIGQRNFVLDPIELREAESILFKWENQSYLIFWDEGLETTRIFNQTDYPDLVIEKETRSLSSKSASMKWDFDGWPIRHDTSLNAPIYYDAFWFAWYAYFPDSTILEVSDFS